MEIVTALALLAAAGAPAVKGARRALDRMAVTGAREAVVGLVARARSEALLRGGADVVVSEAPGRARVEVTEEEARGGGEPVRRVVARVDLAERFGIEVEVAGRAGRATLHFDGLGLGTMASRSFRFRRGGAEARLVVSGYGRVRRP